MQAAIKTEPPGKNPSSDQLRICIKETTYTATGRHGKPLKRAMLPIFCCRIDALCGNFRVAPVKLQIFDSIFSGNSPGFLHRLKGLALRLWFQLYTERNAVFVKRTLQVHRSVGRSISSRSH